MKDLQHENLNTFVGGCVHNNKFFLLSVYCPKGSLQDILMEEEIKLDWSFKTSLVSDIANVSLPSFHPNTFNELHVRLA